jgi:hypothetical protein
MWVNGEGACQAAKVWTRDGAANNQKMDWNVLHGLSPCLSYS